MKSITVQQFHGGIADDIYNGSVGQFSIAKHFDILTYPHRLQPLRGMTAESVTNSKIGNIIVGSDGLMYGVGENPSSPGTSGKLWQRSGYGASDVWQSIPNIDQVVAAVYKSPFLVEFKDCSTVRKIFWAATNLILNSDVAGGSSVNSQSLTFTNIGQGLVHQQYKNLYIPYDNFIRNIPFGSETLSAVLLTLPTQYQIPCLAEYGNYLAIPTFSSNGIGVNGSMVFLWDTVSSSWNEQIKWSQGQLKVLNNLNGTLIGISTSSAAFNGSIQDESSILIKGYSGGIEPFLIKEILAQHLPNSSGNAPVVTINPNVNFIYQNRLYFSVNIVPTDTVSNSYYGLWSVGKNKVNGQWTVNMERIATNANTETGVLAAAITGDFVEMCHTADGTLTYTINGTPSSATYGATSVYESVINPNMPITDKILNKSLLAVAVHTTPLLTGQQVVMKYRVNSTGSWTTLFTKTSTSPDTNLTEFDMTLANSASGAVSGHNIEFRLESTGGAVITGFSYQYDLLKSNSIT